MHASDEMQENKTRKQQMQALTSISIGWLPARASLAYENIVRFSRDFNETILVWKFPSHEIGEKCANCRL